MKKIIFILAIILTIVFSSNAGALTLNSETDEVFLGGEVVGLKLNTGVVIEKTFAIDDGIKLARPWKDANLCEKDVITSYGKYKVESANDLIVALEKCGPASVEITYLRNNLEYHSTITPIVTGNSYSLGIYVKDNIMGIGTLTYVIPQNFVFGALGHQIEGVTVNKGQLLEAKVIGIKKGVVGEAGSKRATINTKTIGTIEKSTITGIHGVYEANDLQTKIKIGKKETVHNGKAEIYTCISGNEVSNFEIEITSVNKQSKQAIKGIKFKVVDDDLLVKTGGIIQGMSGSPIVQDGKLVGAVTHVLVNTPDEGYGIFIEFMLEDMGITVT